MTTLAIYLIGVAVVFAATYFSLGFVIAWLLLYSDHHNFAVTQTPADRGIEARSLTIPTGDQTHLSAWVLAPEKSLGGACIVMVHGFDSGKDKVWEFPEDDQYRASILEQGAESMWRAGFHVVAIDLRNHGESSDNGPVTLGANESDDVLAVLDYLIAHADEFGIDPTRIGLRGESMGGATCLIAAGRDTQNRIAAVWSDSAFSDAGSAILDFMSYKKIPRLFGPAARFWLVQMAKVDLDHSSPIAMVEHIECPVFLTHSSGDIMLPVSHLTRLAESLQWREKPESLVLQAHHHNRLWREPGYHERQIDFFRRKLTGRADVKHCA